MPAEHSENLAKKKKDAGKRKKTGGKQKPHVNFSAIRQAAEAGDL